MKALFTGASSPLGTAVLAHVLASPRFEEVSCTVHEHVIPLQSPKLRPRVLDLAAPLNADEFSPAVDLLIHFASVTRARDARTYRRVNVEGSLRLVEALRQRGCRNAFYVSTRCVGPQERTLSCGAYGESKRVLEDALLNMDWHSLVIVRPAEVYGAGTKEGIDQFIRLARTFRIVPMIVGDPRVRFAPLHYQDFVRIVTEFLDVMPKGSHVYELCGPEVLDGAALAKTLSKTFSALPIPVWCPMLTTMLRGLAAIGAPVVAPDQIDRLIGDKSSEIPSATLISRSHLTTFHDGLRRVPSALGPEP